MTTTRLTIAMVIFSAILVKHAHAGVAYEDPTGGWAYTFNANETDIEAGDGFTALDGTWSHDNGSDSWDGSLISIGVPGGILPFEDADIAYLRLQDTGDPRNDGAVDPSNRKLFFGHDITAEGASENVLDEGITISFRARVPMPGDGLFDGNYAAPNGYVVHDGGKSSFTISQLNPPTTISFALAMGVEDNTGLDLDGGGLIMNNLNGDVVSAAVDWQGDEGIPNVLPVVPTEWNEFWINVFSPSATGEGTHTVAVYANGSEEPTVFAVTGGTGRDYADISYIALGLGSTPQSGALDVDFFSWVPGTLSPKAKGGGGPQCDFNTDGVCDIVDLDELMYTGLGGNDAKYDLNQSGGPIDLDDRNAFLSEVGSFPGDFDLDGKVVAGDLNVLGGNWQKTGLTSYASGDSNGDGMANASDLNDLGTNWQKGAVAAPLASAVPEPSSGWMLLLALSGLGMLRRSNA